MRLPGTRLFSLPPILLTLSKELSLCLLPSCSFGFTDTIFFSQYTILPPLLFAYSNSKHSLKPLIKLTTFRKPFLLLLNLPVPPPSEYPLHFIFTFLGTLLLSYLVCSYLNVFSLPLTCNFLENRGHVLVICIPLMSGT